MNSTFINIAYARHRGALLYEREKALLAETVPVAKLTKEIRDITSQLAPIQKQYDTLYKEYTALKGLKGRSTKYIIDDIQYDLSALRERISGLFIRKRMVEVTISHGQNTTAATARGPKYIRPCAGENCRGFINTGMECSLCETKYCGKCHEILNESQHHSCKNEDIQSAIMIMKDSKNCPNCHVVTYKISGCSQMWCTLCHTVWNWTTGNVETGVVHNPHYFEYMRRNGRLPMENGGAGGFGGQNMCGNVEEQYRIGGTIQRLELMHPGFIYHMIRLRNHVFGVEIPKFVTNQVRENRDLRIRYLLNEIDETRFKQLLHQREKRSIKKREFEQVMRMFSDVLLDLMAKFNASSSREGALAIESEFRELCNFTNESLKQVGLMFKCKYPYIDNNSYTIVNVC